MRFVPVVVVFAVAAAVALGAVVFGIHGDALAGYVIFSLLLGVPLCFAISAFARSQLTTRSQTVAGAARAELLPPGVSWVYPPHVAGDCHSPETPADADVED